MSVGEVGAFDLRSGMFATCSGYWDEKNKFHLLDSTEMAECCFKGCAEPVKYCLQYCKTHNKNDPLLTNKCFQMCNDQKNICFDTCKLNSSNDSTNYYMQCCYDHGCKSLDDTPDADCVRKNKEKIFECCRHNCIPTRNLDCQKHCEFLQDITLNPENREFPSVQNLDSEFIPFRITKNIWIYIIAGLLLSFLVILFLHKTI